MRAAQTLDEILRYAGTVRLYRRQSGYTAGESKTRSGQRTQVINAPVIHGKGSSERQKVEVSAEFRVVSSDTPGEIVFDLIPVLCAPDVGIRLASEVGKARNIDRRIGSSWNLR